MKRKTIVAALAGTIAIVGVSIVGIRAWNYVHPDLAARSSDDLRREAGTMWTSRVDSPLPIMLLAAWRQEHICNTLAERMPAEIEQWIAVDRNEEQQEESTSIAATLPALAVNPDETSR